MGDHWELRFYLLQSSFLPSEQDSMKRRPSSALKIECANLPNSHIRFYIGQKAKVTSQAKGTPPDRGDISLSVGNNGSSMFSSPV